MDNGIGIAAYYRNYHHYAAIILELGTVGKILVTASILDLSNFKFQEFIMMSPIEFYLPGTYPPGTYARIIIHASIMSISLIPGGRVIEM